MLTILLRLTCLTLTGLDDENRIEDGDDLEGGTVSLAVPGSPLRDNWLEEGFAGLLASLLFHFS